MLRKLPQCIFQCQGTKARRVTSVGVSKWSLQRRIIATEDKGGFDMNKLRVEKRANPLPKPAAKDLVFGHFFSDHMLECDWTQGEGWQDLRIVPFHNFDLSPATICLHYAGTVFEGMKAYRVGDRTMLFRPEQNMMRMNESAARVTLPTFPVDDAVEALKRLVKLDRSWIPEGEGYSLYIRPQIIATEPHIGVQPSSNAKWYVICGPVGAYYKTGFKAVKLFADTEHVRAWPGGTGFAKCGGNYAMGLLPQRRAAQMGCAQVLWLFGKEQFVTEVGTMNCFVFWKNEQGEKELITAPLDGTILPGVTRDCILHLAREWGEFKVSERPYTMPQIKRAADEGRLYEVFGAGTAAVVAPVKGIMFEGSEINIPLNPKEPTAQAGPLAMRVWKAITDIQYGRVPHDWLERQASRFRASENGYIFRVRAT